ncbi:MAG TPA: hypothetical protein DCG34_10755 [Clostridiales bacterium]|nr:hypothetical protein [Clostridiales bacterium]
MKSRRFIVLIVTVVLLTSMMVLPALATTYEVQSGDMLYRIAQKYGVTVQQIVDANDIKNPDLIYPGDKLLIPDGIAAKDDVEITILHTNDVHSRVSFSANDGMGYEKLSTIVKEMRAKNPNTLVMDAGDAFHGQTISTLNKGESIVQIITDCIHDLHNTLSFIES